jgi:hypothetical protein
MAGTVRRHVGTPDQSLHVNWRERRSQLHARPTDYSRARHNLKRGHLAFWVGDHISVRFATDWRRLWELRPSHSEVIHEDGKRAARGDADLVQPCNQCRGFPGYQLVPSWVSIQFIREVFAEDDEPFFEFLRRYRIHIVRCRKNSGGLAGYKHACSSSFQGRAPSSGESRPRAA